MSRAFAEFGCIDLLTHDADFQHGAPVDEFPVDQWAAILAITVSAACHTTRLALRAMNKMGPSRIVNMASMHARSASPDQSACVAARYGVVAFTKAVALEVAASITGAIQPIEGGWTAQ
jgi:3-hydroxybutyrate dehydrogenase